MLTNHSSDANRPLQAAGTLATDPWRLLQGTLHRERADLANGYLRVDRREDGSSDLGLPPFGEGGPAAEPAPVSPARATLECITLEYHDSDFD